MVELTRVEDPLHKVVSPKDNVPASGACVTLIRSVADVSLPRQFAVPLTV